MNTKEAIKIRKSMQSCKRCTGKSLPKLGELLTQSEVVIWANRKSTSTEIFERMISGIRVDVFVGSVKTCKAHRDRIMRATQALWEVDFQPDGSVEQVAPTVRKARSWWTLYWREPTMVKKSDQQKWLSQGRALGQMVRGAEKLPKMPRNLKSVTDDNKRDQLRWELKSYGYTRVYLDTMGESIVVTRDDDVEIPQGYERGAPVFVLEELVKLRGMVGMKPDPEMMQAVWLLKKHLGVRVVS